MKVIAERLAQLPELELHQLNHKSFEEGHCAMELVAWLAGEEHSDNPECVSKLIAATMRSFNDSIESQAERTRLLKPLLLETIGTRPQDMEQALVLEKRRMGLGWRRLIKEILPELLADLQVGLELRAHLLSMPDDPYTIIRSNAAYEAAQVPPKLHAFCSSYTPFTRATGIYAIMEGLCWNPMLNRVRNTLVSVIAATGREGSKSQLPPEEQRAIIERTQQRCLELLQEYCRMEPLTETASP